MLPEPLIEFTTRTPLWTGGEDKRSERALETGVLGSLRWWTEVYLRGHGYAIPDIGSTGGDGTAAKWFGSTEDRRKFRFILTQSPECQQQLLRDGTPGRQEFCIPSTSPRKQTPGQEACWYFPSQPLAGRFRIRMPGAGAFDVERLDAVLTIASEFGAIGARAQSGCGVILTEMALRDALKILEDWREASPPKSSELDRDLPSLRNLFFGEYSVPSEHPAQTGQHLTFLLRQRVRDSLRGSVNGTDTLRDVRHQVCGTISGSRVGSKVFVSFPYEDSRSPTTGIMRVWGWLPARLESGLSRRQVLNRVNRAVRDLSLAAIQPDWSGRTDGLPEILSEANA